MATAHRNYAQRCWRSKPYVIITHFPCQIAQHKIKWTHTSWWYTKRDFKTLKEARLYGETSSNGETKKHLSFFLCYVRLVNKVIRGGEREKKLLPQDISLEIMWRWFHDGINTYTQTRSARETYLTKIGPCCVLHFVECKYSFMHKKNQYYILDFLS